MLHNTAVPLTLFRVLSDLQAALADTGFTLAGGTSLALRFGHRVSVDLDFFTNDPFDPPTLADQIGATQASITGMSAGSLQLRIGEVKVEFFHHAYPLLANPDLIEGIRFASLADVAAMKLNAIINRGSKKDFHDIALLLDHLPLPTMIAHYQAKYHPASLLMVVRSLAWFDDADAEPDPISLHNDSWPAIKAKISSAIRSLQ